MRGARAGFGRALEHEVHEVHRQSGPVQLRVETHVGGVAGIFPHLRTHHSDLHRDRQWPVAVPQSKQINSLMELFPNGLFWERAAMAGRNAKPTTQHIRKRNEQNVVGGIGGTTWGHELVVRCVTGQSGRQQVAAG